MPEEYKTIKNIVFFNIDYGEILINENNGQYYYANSRGDILALGDDYELAYDTIISIIYYIAKETIGGL